MNVQRDLVVLLLKVWLGLDCPTYDGANPVRTVDVALAARWLFPCQVGAKH